MGKYLRHDFEVVDDAWGDHGDSIVTGQIGSTDTDAEPVPDQGSLFLLALGGAGLMAWRKQRAGRNSS